ncbi:UDP-N-acetylglucosamine 2-epimerase [Sphaerochaeta sp. PS]|uniref:UDP-N-acetylglucosamine 2-epimerase n=1 Tax=Sphaerochaeta sp. PS TaxID=3076336 RepID=UPI0028A44C2F|nr:UDP-N-acetylglucosamine 2-epimerase [Sphaerochaeta sp. PS]MDT4763428.1 UDP-N-acetylglucosamine 2-epimerase [Sphaerochaeta sp. PS]
MKKIISILTATRAEYGLLHPLILKLQKLGAFDVRVVVTGAHLSPEFGLTYKEIEEDNIEIDKKIEILLSSDTPSSISKSMGLAMIGFSDYFSELKPDLLIVLGDRYETLAVCCVAMNQRIPIAHLYGGETTEGAIDESIRHAITKLSYLHFTSTEEYRKRVIQLGEDPSRVFNVGALGIENIKNEKLLDRAHLEESLGLSLDGPFAMVTFHPVTLEKGSSAIQFKTMLDAFHAHPDLKFVFSKANADADGRIINQMIDTFVATHKNAVVFASLGTKLYISTVKHSAFVIGNSSSGIVEVPSLHIPTINVGDRQKGRLQAGSTINCEPTSVDIERAITYALSEECKEKAKTVENPYGDGNSSELIASCIKRVLSEETIDLKKQFFDLKVIEA